MKNSIGIRKLSIDDKTNEKIQCNRLKNGKFELFMLKIWTLHEKNWALHEKKLSFRRKLSVWRKVYAFEASYWRKMAYVLKENRSENLIWVKNLEYLPVSLIRLQKSKAKRKVSIRLKASFNKEMRSDVHLNRMPLWTILFTH